jgi:hypothetical protein
LNTDFKRRLKRLGQLSNKEWRFLEALEDRLIAETTDRWIVIEYTKIDTKDDDTAFVDFDGEEFHLVVDERLQFGTITDYLLHEFAHIGTWFVGERDDHGPIFGVEWARLYRIYLKLYDKWFDGNRRPG